MGRRRPRLFSFGREIELANLDAWVDDPGERAVLVEAIDAFIEITRTRKLTPERLAAVAASAGHTSDGVRAIGVSRLVVLAHYFDEARASLATLATHPDAGVRLYACASLANAPEDALPPLLDTYLADVDWQVRKSAAQVSATSRSADLLDVIRRHLPDERDARVRVQLELAERFQTA